MTASAWQTRSGQRAINDMMGIGCLKGIIDLQQQARGHARLILFERISALLRVLQLDAFLCKLCPGGNAEWDHWFDNWSTSGKDSLVAALTRSGAPDAAACLALDVGTSPLDARVNQPVLPKPAKGSASPAHDVTWRMLLEVVRHLLPGESVAATPRNELSDAEQEVDSLPSRSPSPARAPRSLRSASASSPTKPVSSAAKTPPAKTSPARPAGVPRFASRFCAWFRALFEQCYWLQVLCKKVVRAL